MTTPAVEVPVTETPPPVIDDRGDNFQPEPESGTVKIDPEFNPEILAAIAKGDDPPAVVPPVVTPSTDETTPVIPRARFNEVNEENKRLKEQLAASVKQTPAEETTPPVQQEQMGVNEIAALETRRAELQDKADNLFQETGVTEARKQVLTELAKVNREIAKIEWQQEQQQERAQHDVAVSLESVAATAFVSFPFLDVNSPDADVDAINAVRFHRDQLMAEGKSPAEALKSAVDEKGPKFAKILGVTATPDTTQADKVRQQREQQARTTSAAASIAQPPALPGKVGEESFAVNIDKMDEKQFKQFQGTEAAARARGDIL